MYMYLYFVPTTHECTHVHLFVHLQMYILQYCRSGLSTYKELCSLASDLNKPDLVYKFMSLANHHAIWNSKKVHLYM